MVAVGVRLAGRTAPPAALTAEAPSRVQGEGGGLNPGPPQALTGWALHVCHPCPKTPLATLGAGQEGHLGGFPGEGLGLDRWRLILAPSANEASW
jgi:hypothetical protein